jgi:hypothetical protein
MLCSIGAVVGNLMEDMPFALSNEEYAHMYFICGFYNRSAVTAIEE